MTLRDVLTQLRLLTAEAAHATRQVMASQQRSARPSALAALEDRVMFSATAAPPPDADLAVIQEPTQFQTVADEAANDSPASTGLASDGERQDLGSQTAETITGTGSEAGSASTDTVRASESGMDVVASAEATYELVFVDDSVADYEQLVSEILSAENLDRRLDIIFLTADRDGIEQVSEALAGYDNLDAIHFISHGADGAVKLGSTWLTNDNLAGYAGQIAGWADALTTDADLLFYGCDLAAHVEGQQLVAALSALTDADVAASTDDTGDAQLGGNWTLEYAHGAITATTVLTAETGAEWHALLNAFIVTNTNDVGAGSLRQAIIDANALPGTDTITFNIAGAGPHTIAPTGAFPLPPITDPLIIDGYTQPGSSVNTLSTGNNAVLLIELTGTNAGSVAGLTLDAGSDGSTIRGLVINRFSLSGIQINSTNNLIVGNFIGTDSTGSSDLGNTLDGVTVSANDNTIGSAAVGDRNLIAGNNDEPIDVDVGVSGTVIKGNYLGTNAAGTAAIANGTAGNANSGFLLIEGDNSIVGGTNPGEGNLVSGSTHAGIFITSSGNTVQGNLIGTDATGTTTLANQGPGVQIGEIAGVQKGANNLIGGVAANAGNIIAFNTAGGISLDSGAGTGNALLGNTIFSNSGIGIDLDANGVTLNNGTKSGALANSGMDYPMLTSASLSGTMLTVAGFVGAAASQSTFASARVEFYKSDGDSSGYGEGPVYLGSLTSDASGNFSGSVDVTGKGLSAGDKITATATDAANNTSEFGANIVVNNSAPVLSGSANLPAINEDPASNPGQFVSSLIGGQITDADAGAQTGIAVVAVVNTNGNWQYSINGGSNWSNFGSPSSTTARLLTSDAGTLVRFVPNANWSGNVASGLTFRAWDRTEGVASGTMNVNANGANTAFSSATASAGITVNAVNDDPVITSNGGGPSAAINVAENTTTVTTVTSTDIDGGSPVYSILAGGDGSKFKINSTTGALSFVTAPDFENPSDAGLNNVYNLTVQVSDGVTGTDSQAISVTVTNFVPVAVDDAYAVDADATLDVEWWDTNWTRRQQITFDNLAQSETLIDFPVLVVLNSGNIDYAQTKDDGSDLRFFAADGTPLAYEIEQWDEGGESSVWVRVPQITGSSNSDSIWMYYGNATAAPAADSASVWDGNFVGVWHLNEEQAGTGTAGVYQDSTAYGNDGIDRVAATGQEGQVTAGQQFGANDWIEIAHDPVLDLTDSMTISFWIKPTSNSGTFNRVVEKGLWGYNNSYYFGGGNGTNDLTFYLNGQGVFDTTDNVLTVGVWQHAAVSYTSNGDGTGTARLYVNGAEVATGNYTNGAVVGNTGRLAIGHDDPSYDFDGFVDEVQISNTDRSADWIAAHYQATKNLFGAEFVQLGGEQVAPIVGGVMENDLPDGYQTTVTNLDTTGTLGLVTLSADGTFSYDPNGQFDYLADGISTSDTFTYTVTDGVTTSAAATVTINITGVNDAPTLGNGSLAAVNEDTTNPAGQSVSTIFTGQFADIDAGSSFSGIAVVGNSANAGTQGAWQYSTNGGTNWFAIGTVADDATALAISSSTLIRFLPVADYNGAPPALIVRGLDDTYGGGFSTTAGSETRVNVDTTSKGGITAIAAATANLSTSVTAVNDAPVRTAGSPAAIIVNEDSANATAVTLGMSGLTYGRGGGSDESGQTLTYKVTVIPAHITLWLADGTTQVTANTTVTLAQLQGLKYKTVANANGSGNLTWTVQDNGGTANGGVDTLTENLSITVNAVNDVPVRTAGSPAAINVNEDSANATAVTLGMSGLTYGRGGGSDESGQTLTYKVTVIPAHITLWLADGTTQVTANTTVTLTQLQGLKYKTVANANGSGNLTWTVQDNGGTANGGVDTLTENLSITVNAVNDAPVRTAGSPAAINVNEDSANATAVTLGMSGLTYGRGGGSDESGQTLTYKVTVIPAHITLWLADGTTQVTANTTVTLTQLQGLKYKTVANANGSGNLTWTVQDNGGTANGGVDTLTENLAITVNAVNDAPVRTAGSPAAINVNEDSANATAVTLGMSGLTYGRGGGSDESGQTLTYKVTVIPAHITLWLANGTTQVTANTTVTLTQLQGLKYKTVANANGSGNLTWTVQDNGGTANGGVNTLTENLSITVHAVADTPSVTNANTNEDTQSTTGLVISRNVADGAEVTHFKITGITNGTLYKNDGTTQITNGTFVTFAEGNAGLKFTPTANFNGNGSFTIQASTSNADGGLGGSTVNATITVNAVNDAPLLDNTKSPTLATINEDAVAPLGDVGTLVSDLVDFASPAGEVDNVTDADAGAFLGIAVTGADAANGTWYYSINDGANWNALGSVSDVNARLLAADGITRLYFEPNANYNGTLASAITFRAWDQTSGSNGGTANLTSTSTVLDQFNAVSYSNNDGSVNWTGAWQEIGESDGTGAGMIAVTTYAGMATSGLQIETDFLSRGVSRQVDLSSATSATLSFNFIREHGGGTNGVVSLGVYNGSTWTTVHSFNINASDASAQSYSVDISDYANANTQIRFLVTGNDTLGRLHVDNVQVSYTTVTGTGGTTAFSTATDTASIVVNPVNDAPALGNGSLAAVNEDTASPGGETVSTIFTGQFADIDAGSSFGGIAVVGNTANAGTQGSWQYSTNGGGNWFGIGTVGDDATALAVSSSTLIRFLPVADYNGSPPDLVVRGLDNTYGGGFSTTAGSETRVNVDTASNGGATSIADATANLSTSISAVADTPSVTNTTTNEDTQSTSGLVISRNVADGAEVTHFKITGITNGTLYKNDGTTQITNGSFITFAEGNAGLKFTPTADFNGNGSITIQASTSNVDGGLGGSTVNATITVNAINDAPTVTATGSALAYTENDAATVIDAGLTVSDPDNVNLDSVVVRITGNFTTGQDVLAFTNQLGITGNWNPGTGILTLSGPATVGNYQTALRTVTYQNTSDNPNTAVRTISFTADDGTDSGIAATRNINITAVNDVPVATDNTVSTNEDTPLNFASGDFTFTDVEGDALVSAQLTNLSLNGGTLTHSGGTAVSNGDTLTAAQLDTLVYSPPTNQNGLGYASFDFRVNDSGAGTVAATMTIDVTAVNDVPVASNNTLNTNEDTPLNFASGDFTFTDVEGDTLVSAQLTNLSLNGGTLTHSGGTAVNNGDTLTAAQLDTLVYTPPANQNGLSFATFDFQVNDSGSGTVAATMTIDVNAVNDVPVASNNTLNTNEDTPLNFASGDFTFTDVEGDTLVSAQLTNLSLNGGTLTHSGGTAVNNGDTLTAAQLDTLVYTPPANQNGLSFATFDFQVNDSGSGTVAATMTIDVNAVNDVPVATDNTVNTNEDTPLNFASGDFTFTDVEGDALVSAQLTNLNLNGGTLTHSGGTAVNNGDTLTAAQLDTLVYTPPTNQNGLSFATFDFQVNDSGSGTVAATMTIDVTAVNDVPVATDNTVNTNEDTPLNFASGDFTFTDVEGDALVSVQLTNLNLNGGTLTHSGGTAVNNVDTLTAAQLDTLVYTPPANQNGLSFATFDFQVNDSGSGTVAATMTIDVTAVNDVPVATDNTVNTNEDTPLNFASGDFTFTDVEGDALVSVQLTNLNLNGGTLTHSGGTAVNNVDTLTAAQLDTLVYTPPANQNGLAFASFDFRVNDSGAGTVAATMTIDVTAVNDVPVASNNTVSTNEDTPLNFSSGDFTFTDVEGDALVSAQFTGLNLNGGTLTHSGGTAVNNGDTLTAAQLDTLVYTPPTNQNGLAFASFDFRVNDSGAGTVAATMTIDVTAVNDVPVASNNTVSTNEDTPLNFASGDFTFSDVEGDALVSAQLTNLNLNGGTLTHSGGTAVNNGDTLTAAQLDTLVYTPPANQNGLAFASFDFRVNDSGAGTVAATMTIDVTAVNDVPVASNNTVSTNEDTPLNFASGDFTFSDVEGDALVSAQLTGLNLNGGTLTHSGGTAVNNGDTLTAAQLDTLVYTPPTNQNGLAFASFDFQVNDSSAGTVAATMTIDVTAVNDVPVASNNTLGTNEDTPLNFASGDFTFTDVEGDALVSAQLTNLSLNGGTLTHSGGTAVSNGDTLTAAQLDTLVYTPPANQNGLAFASFDFQVNDSGSGTVAATMTIDVTAVNDVPVASNNTLGTNEDTPLNFASGDFTFSDVEGDALVSAQLTGLNLNGGTLTHSGGTAVNNGDTLTAAQLDTLVYTPPTNQNGLAFASFDFRVNDTGAGTVAATMTIDVTAVNDVPVASNNTVSTNEDTPLNFASGDFTFSDVEGDALVSAQITNLNLNGGTLTHSGGTAVNNGDTLTAGQLDTLVYTPPANQNGLAFASFDFRVNDSGAGTVAATMTIDVTAANDVPVASNNTLGTNEDTPLNFASSDFTFTDVEGDALVSAQITNLNLNGGTLTHSGGTAVNNGDTLTAGQLDTLVYTPPTNQNGLAFASFDFQVNDSGAGTVAATMTIDVTAVNDVPVASNNTLGTNEDAPLNFASGDFTFTDVEGDALVSAQITNLNLNGGTLTHSGGTAVNNGDTLTAAQLDTLVYTPPANQNGLAFASFDFRVNDSGAGTVAATMTIDVTAVNDVPVASNNTVSTNEDTPLNFASGDFTFSDVEGDALVSAQLTGLNLNGGTLTHSGGTAVNNGDTLTAAQLDTLVYTPPTNQNGLAFASFDFRVNDSGAGTVAATMTIDVTAVNDVPVASNNTLSTNEDTPLNFASGDFSFTDVEGDALVSAQLTNLSLNGGTLTHSGGTAVNNGDTLTAAQLDTLIYTPPTNQNGVAFASFDFRVNDSGAGTVAATMTIDVTAVNDVPVASNNTVSTNEDTPLNFSSGDFTFTDVEGDALVSAQLTGLNLNGGTLTHSGGTAVNNGDTLTAAQLDTLVYTPPANQNGLAFASFDFQVNDSSAGTVAATMTIDVTAVNDVPVTSNNTVSTNEDTPLNFASGDFSFTDVEGDALVSAQLTNLSLNGGTLTHSGGTAVNNGDTLTAAQLDTLVYSPPTNQNGLGFASFDFRVNDSGAGTVAATMTIDVTAVNDVPVASNNTVSTNEDTPLNFASSDFTFSDVEGDALVSAQITNLNLNGGTLTHSGGTAVNNGDTLTAAQLDTLVYSPPTNQNGLGFASFDFRVNDSGAGTVAATMTIDVTAVNDVPVASNNTVSTNEDTPLNFASSDFTFSDVEGDALVSAQITNLNLNGGTLTHSGGTAVNNGDTLTAGQLDTLVYTPPTNQNGLAFASFDFRVNDSGAGTVAATMTIDVTAVNDVPVASNNTVSTNEDTPLNFASGDFTFTDVEGDALVSAQLTNLSLNGGTLTHSGGTAVNNGDTLTAAQLDTLIYTPPANQNGLAFASFDFQVNDSGSGTVAATMTIDVTAVNDVPVASNNTVSTNEDTPLNFASGDFTFSDVEGDALVSAQLTGLNLNGGTLTHSGGTAVNNGDTLTAAQLDTLIYTPPANQNGLAFASFDFQVNDSGSGTVGATMTIDVNAVNDVPVATDNTLNTNEDTPLNFASGDFTFSDVEGDALVSAQLTGLNLNGGTLTHSGGTAVNNGDTLTAAQLDTLVYTPPANQNSLAFASFDFRVNDSGAGTVAATMTIDVTAVNDVPVASNNTLGTNEDTPLNFTSSDFTFTDVEGDALVSAQITNLNLNGGTLTHSGGTAVNNGDALTAAQLDTLVYTPPANQNGLAFASFDFRVNDSGAGTVAATMTIDVTAVNDVPVASNNTVSTNEDTPLNFISGDFTFSDVEGDALVSAQLTNLSLNGGTLTHSGGTAVNNGDTLTAAQLDTLVYTPPANQNGLAFASFDFQVNDTGSGTVAATMTIDVTAVNDVPVASNNTVSTNEDTPLNFASGDFTFTDVEGDALVSAQLTGLNLNGGTLTHSGGTAVNNGDTLTAAQLDTLVYTPPTNQNGLAFASFDFRVNDSGAGTVAATMTIDVTAANDVPVASNNTVSTNEDTPLNFASGDFSFTDVEGDALVSAQLTNLSLNGGTLTHSGGTAVNNGDTLTAAQLDTLIYTPPANQNGLAFASFDFRVNDTGAGTVAATMTIDVTAVNDVPVASNNTLGTNEDTPLNFISGDFTFSDVEGDALVSAQLTGLSLNGGTLTHSGGTAVNNGDTLTAAQLDTLIYTPPTNQNGLAFASFDFRVNDSGAGTVAAKMTIDVTAVNDAPTLANGTLASVAEDATSLAGQTVSTIFTGQFADIDAGSSFGGIAVVDNTADAGTQGTWQYSSNGGTNWFAIGAVADDATALAISSSTRIRFVPVADYYGDPPDLVVRGLDNSYAGGFSTTAGSETRVNIDTTTHGGTTAIAAATANLATSINAVADTPSVTNATTNEDTQSTTGLVISRNVVDGAEVTHFKITGITNGTLYQNDGVTQITNGTFITFADGSAGLKFTPAANFNGNGSFTVQASISNVDAGLGGSTVNATITVNPVNDEESLDVNAPLTLDEGATATLTNSYLATSDVEQAAAQITYTIDVAPSNGLLQLSGITLSVTDTFTQDDIDSLRLRYIHNGGETTSDQFDFTVDDAFGTSTSATFQFSVTPVNDAPVNVIPGLQTAAKNTPLTFSAANGNAISIQDADAGNGLLLVTLTATNGTLTLGTTANLTFTMGAGTNDAAMTFLGTLTDINIALDGLQFRPNNGVTGSAALQITVDDQGNAGSGIAGVDSDTIPIAVANQAPVASPDRYSGNQFEPITILPRGVLLNDSDPNGDPLSAVLVQGPLHGTLVLKADGSFTYSPDATFSGQDHFTYLAFDGQRYSQPVTVWLDVQAVAPGPSDGGGGDSPPPTDGGDDEPTDVPFTPALPAVTQTTDAPQTGSRPVSQGNPQGQGSPIETSRGNEEPSDAGDDGDAYGLDQLASRAPSSALRLSRLTDAIRPALPAMITGEILTLDVSGWSDNDTQPRWHEETNLPELVIGTTAIVSTALSVGYVVWMLRSSSLLLSFMSAIPVWCSFDPLVILESFEDSHAKDKDEESTESLASLVSDASQTDVPHENHS